MNATFSMKQRPIWNWPSLYVNKQSMSLVVRFQGLFAYLQAVARRDWMILDGARGPLERIQESFSCLSVYLVLPITQ